MTAELKFRQVTEFLSLTVIAVSVVFGLCRTSGWPIVPSMTILLIISTLSALLCLIAIPEVGKLLVKAGLAGRDCHRPANTDKLPEGTGVAVGFTFVIALTIFVPFLFVTETTWSSDQIGDLAMFLSALLSITSMCFLGFADNVLDLRWRHKLILPTIASLPVLLVYYVQQGSTFVLLPDVLRNIVFPNSPSLAVDFGFFYYIFLSMLSVFGTNAINILAGLNGLEVGQSIVLCSGMIINTLIQMNRHEWTHWKLNNETVFALYIMVPFLLCSISLWVFNKYPAQVFVGDTYCYLAGTVLAVAGILGHCSKTLVLLMVPQVINFVYSIPQLFKLIPCPRHRLPAYVEKTDCVNVSFTEWMDESRIWRPLLALIEGLRLAKIERKHNQVRCSNLTIINYVLWKIGRPVNEGKLVSVLLGMQVAYICAAIILRYKMAAFFYTLVD